MSRDGDSVLDAVSAARSWLFVPADRPDRLPKASAAGADLVVLDLEDAVAPGRKEEARRHARQWLQAGNAAVVRINGADSRWHLGDLSAVGDLAEAIMLPKATARTAFALHADVPVIALVESAAGVLDSAALANTHGVARLALGAIDLAAELGVDPDTSPLIDRARAALAYASAAAGLPAPVDGVTPAVGDAAALARDIDRARAHGFTGKLCIHPRQLESVHRSMAPADAEVAWAMRILDGVEVAGAAGGVVTVDGVMVDKPVIDRARRIAALAPSA